MATRPPAPQPPRIATTDFLCPTCGEVTVFRCGGCDATAHVDPVSGRVTWMLNGRVVKGSIAGSRAEAFVRAATHHGLPVERWPEAYAPLGAIETRPTKEE